MKAGHMVNRNLMLICLLWALPLAAQENPPGIEFSIARDIYATGDTLRFRVTNGGDQPLSYTRNLCMAQMQRRVDDGWEAAALRAPLPPSDPPQVHACPLISTTVRPGESREHANWVVLPHMLSGVYRIRVEAWSGDDPRDDPFDINSTDFTIRQGPEPPQ